MKTHRVTVQIPKYECDAYRLWAYDYLIMMVKEKLYTLLMQESLPCVVDFSDLITDDWGIHMDIMITPIERQEHYIMPVHYGYLGKEKSRKSKWESLLQTVSNIFRL